MDIFQCRPIEGAWNPTLDADCVQIKAFWIVMGIMNVLTDFALLFAPLPQLWALQMRRDTKIELIGIFSIGGLLVTLSHNDSVLRASLIWRQSPTASLLSPSTAFLSSTISLLSTQDGRLSKPLSGRLWRSALPLYAPPPSHIVLYSTTSSAYSPRRLLPLKRRSQTLLDHLFLMAF